MLRNLILIALMGLSSTISAASVAYITSSNGSNSTSNNSVLEALNAAFGSGNYTTYGNLPSLSLSTLSTYDFVYVEGGIVNGSNFSSYLNGNRSVLEQYVDQGGRLFLDGGRTGNGTQTQSLDLGFGTTLVGNNADSLVAVVNDPALGSPTVVGGLPIGGDFVVGPGTALITNLSGDTLLLERTYGQGMAWFGGLTTPNYGTSNASLLWRNMLDYMANSGLPPGAVPEPSLLALLATAVMIFMIVLSRNARARSTLRALS
jgi:hypothetical protein